MTRSPASCTKGDLKAGLLALETRLDKRIGEVETRLDKRIGEVETRLEKRIGQLDEKIEASTKEVLHHFDVVWEEMKSALKATGEGRETERDQVAAKIAHFETEHSQRLSAIEGVVKQHSLEIVELQKRRPTKPS